MNEVERYGSPIYREQPAPQLISRRLYNLVLTGFVVLSFVIMAACSYITGTREFLLFMVRNPMLVTVGSLVGSIGGIIAMSIGRSRENLTLGLIGYAFFSLTFGFTTSIALSAYDMESISMAFTATAGIMIVFGAAGFMFPDFFARLQGVLAVGLLAIIAVELVLMFMGVQQSVTDIVVILLFCGFIGYDVYRASTALPTFTNALWYAVDLYLDIINVFLRLLALFGRRD
ncbi:Bax inhibitor-1 family protein [Enorma burkinafasonensis]|uniref:Bax inhibitor-1 family protein n=1 Tax=Enorma burkinafasonensis TaxID=2590867 RepID=UPI00119CB4D4|nr:Bax inhibitor-1 family protein [Enorma burkinafasonensis]